METTSKINIPGDNLKKVPDFLIKEILNGKPVYYKGYKEVLAKTKKPDERY